MIIKHDYFEVVFKPIIIFRLQLVNPEESVTRLYAQSLVLYGNWLAKTRSESPSIILDKFIRKVGNPFLRLLQGMFRFLRTNG